MKESAKTVAMQHGDKYNDFVASDGWLNRFLLRNDLALRAKTSVSQRLPKDLVPKVKLKRHSYYSTRRRRWRLGGKNWGKKMVKKILVLGGGGDKKNG